MPGPGAASQTDVLPASVCRGVPSGQNTALPLEQVRALLSVDAQVCRRVGKLGKGLVQIALNQGDSAICFIADRVGILLREYGDHGIVADIMQSTDILSFAVIIQRIVAVVCPADSAVLRSSDHKLQIGSFFGGQKQRFCLDLRVFFDNDPHSTSAMHRNKQG